MRALSLVVAAVVTACGPAAPRPQPGPPASPGSSAAPAAPPVAPDPYAALNLDFEKVEDGRPAGWTPGIAAPGGGGDGYETTVDRDGHGGAGSLRLRAVGDERFGAVATAIDATPLRGRRVRLHGWVKTDGVAAPGWAGVWLRVDGTSASPFDNMAGRGLIGTEGWRAVVAEVEVPADAGQLVLGPLLIGPGTAWFDDLRLEIVEDPPVAPISLAGVVVDAAGRPAAGATVTLMDGTGKVTAFVTAGPDGRFRIPARTGSWGMSAHHPAGAGAFFDPRPFAADTSDVRLALGEGGVRVRGRLLVGGEVPAGTHLEVAPYSDHVSDGFAIPVGADGRFEARLPRADRYFARTRGADLSGGAEAERTGDEVVLDVVATLLRPPPAEVNAWVAASAAPLVSAEAGHGFADLKPIGAMVGKARIVGLGEATHGTREFFQLKHRLLEYLVAEHGFTVFAIEANRPECRAINDYVLHGEGDPRKALDGIYFWTWNTEEVLAMIEWMRAWNADPKHAKKVQFLGFDMQTTRVAHAGVVAFLGRVAAAEVEALTAPLAVFGKETAAKDFAAMPAAEAQATLEALAALEQRFERARAAWSRRTGKGAFLDAHEDLRVLAQAAALYRAGDGMRSFAARDLAMADNVDAILARQPRGTRVVLWAHNGHVSNGMEGVTNQGAHLRARHGKNYVAFGFAFGEGSFQAIDYSRGKPGGLQEHTLGPPPAWDVSAPFRATGKPIVVVDLRQAPAGTVADWLAAPHPMRDTGAVFSNEENMSRPQQLSRLYDAVIYVDRTTRARPNPGGLRPPSP